MTKKEEEEERKRRRQIPRGRHPGSSLPSFPYKRRPSASPAAASTSSRASSRRGPQRGASGRRISPGKPIGLTDAAIEAAAHDDPDAQPLTEADIKRLRRVPLAKHARWRAGMSQTRFAEAYEIPVGTLRDWEQGRFEPDGTAQAYLRAIAGDPEGTLRALKRSRRGP